MVKCHCFLEAIRIGGTRGRFNRIRQLPGHGSSKAMKNYKCGKNPGPPRKKSTGCIGVHIQFDMFHQKEPRVLKICSQYENIYYL